MMNLFEIGTVLNVDGMQAQVIGYIIYKNPADSNKLWVDYRLKENSGSVGMKNIRNIQSPGLLLWMAA